MNYSEVINLVDKGYVVNMIILYFSKAFNDANDSIILTKLQMLGIIGKFLSWIREFLNGRTMCVKFAGKLSSLKNVTSGVPQGSVLGSVLFLIYVNYIANSVDCCCKAIADDIMLYLRFPRKTCVPILQKMMRLQKNPGIYG